MVYCWVQVLEVAMAGCDNAYNIPNVSMTGRVCQTNLPSTTGFRGFGSPQGMIIIEQIVERVSCHLKVPATQVRELNMYNDGDTTPFGEVLSICNARRCWEQLKENSSFTDRAAEVDQFNQ